MPLFDQYVRSLIRIKSDTDFDDDDDLEKQTSDWDSRYSRWNDFFHHARFELMLSDEDAQDYANKHFFEQFS